MGCTQGKCCLPRPPGRGSGGGRGRGGATLGRAEVPGAGLLLEYATLDVAGLYPDSPGRESQDAHLVATRFAGDPDLHLFAVFDGHGAAGTACAGFARDALPRLLAAAFRESMLGANAEMHAAAGVDDFMSGTTAVAALVAGGALHVANVGDSRAVAGVWRAGRVVAEDLSWDQTPFRADERARVKACGARVMSVEQVEGMRDPESEGWVPDEGDPPRVWARDGLYPGTAFTRSLGDLAAEAVGVIAEPEVKSVEITPAHLFFVVASDGVFEFLSSQEVVDMVAMYQDPRDACSAIAAESYKLWLEHENRTDDITIIIVHIRDSEISGPAGSDKVDYGSIGASIAAHTVQSEIPVFVPPEASQLNRCAATEMQSSSSGSPTERSLSCVAPSPMHPLLIHGRISDASKPMRSEQAASQVQPWHQVDGGTELEQPMQ
ncbi:probable protein phosphatase 2C 65 isoform X2 [Panicum hallii]|uniref:probable protein phosphatase 2C 65 isoform X2 n=1 Tax=Panicum hallii TaxID=206008 RepID=UPI000DF4E203|nr:probable protein phosphatase 2C 65 isoform X2 [Panicum hallii]